MLHKVKVLETSPTKGDNGNKPTLDTERSIHSQRNLVNEFRVKSADGARLKLNKNITAGTIYDVAAISVSEFSIHQASKYEIDENASKSDVFGKRYNRNLDDLRWEAAEAEKYNIYEMAQ